MAPLAPEFMQASNQAWKNSHASQAKTEYGAVLALEQYYRSAPFKYSLTPNLPNALPPLAEFMLHAHRGYCQMFSGAMALVLRMHGIPARIAVGFTQGRLQGSDTYIVNDRDAHAWVEVYFPGYGWQPFEPTPGAHVPTDTSISSPSFAKTRTGGDPTTSRPRCRSSSASRRMGRRPCRKASAGTGERAATPAPTRGAGS